LTIEDMNIGIMPDGTTVNANMNHGILANHPSNTVAPNITNVTIRNNTISGNLNNGLQLTGVTGINVISGNKIGTTADGLQCVTTGSPNEVGGAGGNGYDGVNLTNSTGF